MAQSLNLRIDQGSDYLINLTWQKSPCPNKTVISRYNLFHNGTKNIFFNINYLEKMLM